MNNSFFQTVPEAPNLWRLVDAKKQQSPAKVIFKKSTSQAASQHDKLTGESLDTSEAAGSSPPQQAIKIVKVSNGSKTNPKKVLKRLPHSLKEGNGPIELR